MTTFDELIGGASDQLPQKLVRCDIVHLLVSLDPLLSRPERLSEIALGLRTPAGTMAGRVELMVMDEAHQVVAPTYKFVLDVLTESDRPSGFCSSAFEALFFGDRQDARVG